MPKPARACSPRRRSRSGSTIATSRCTARTTRWPRCRRAGDSWSIQENAGHLLDLEPLWLRRVGDLADGRPELAEADLTNRQTHEANHNSARLEGLLADFRRARDELVRRLEAFSEGGAAVAALHPRLRVAMNVVDVAYFVAEHDDYHLARITELLGSC